MIFESRILIIQPINKNIYNTNLLNNKTARKNVSSKNELNRDIVSFSSKKYDYDSIVNPTNHCGYCGCKVYSKNQLESIAKEMMTSKSERLQGKIKSVLEKLEGAKYSEEMALAKRLENKKEIGFFRYLLDISVKKPYLKGDMIFDKVYKVNEEEAISLLTKNMHPLLKTVDHISPQNREEENNNADINLLEACYCCNHDIKKGVSFNEFYTMFPSIKMNMPADKFKYASSNVLENGQDGIEHRLSAHNILKSIKRLLLQRNEILSNLNTIDYRISCLQSQISGSIKSIRNDIEDKKSEIILLEIQLQEMQSTSEKDNTNKKEDVEKLLYEINSPVKSGKKNKNAKRQEQQENQEPKREEEIILGKINTLEAEILMMENTIQDLQNQKNLTKTIAKSNK